MFNKSDFIKKIGAVATIGAGALLFTACSSGSDIDTTLSINSDGSGTRSMSVMIDQDVFEENFHGSLNDLFSVINTYCPSDLTWTSDYEADYDAVTDGAGTDDSSETPDLTEDDVTFYNAYLCLQSDSEAFCIREAVEDDEAENGLSVTSAIYNTDENSIDALVPADIEDAIMDTDGEYSVSISNIEWPETAFMDGGSLSSLYVATDIPTTENIYINNVNVTIDGTVYPVDIVYLNTDLSDDNNFYQICIQDIFSDEDYLVTPFEYEVPFTDISVSYEIEFLTADDDLEPGDYDDSAEEIGGTYDYDGDLTINFELTFDSVDDYIAKVTNILGYDPEETFTISNDTFSTGIEISESYTSADLLSWLSTALVDGGFVDADDADMIFDCGNTDVYYGEDSLYNWSDSISVSEIDNYNVNNVYLAIGENGSKYDASIAFELYNPYVAANGAAFESYFAALSPDSTFSIEADDDEYGHTVYILATTVSTLNDVQDYFNSILGDGIISIETTTESSAYNILNVYKTLNVTMDESCELFHLGNNSSSYVYLLFNKVDYAYWTTDIEYYENYEVVDYNSTYNLESYTFTEDYNVMYNISGIDVTLTLNEDDTFDRTVTLLLDQDLDSNDADVIKSAFQEYLIDDDNSDSVSINYSGSNMIFAYSGDAKTISDFDEELFGKGSLKYTIEGNALTVMKKVSFSDKIEFTNLDNVSDDNVINYTATIDKLSSAEASKGDFADGVLTAKFTGNTVKASVEGKIFNLIGLIIILAIVLVVIAAVAVVLIIVLKKAKAKKNNAPAGSANQPAPAAPVAPATPAAPVYTEAAPVAPAAPTAQAPVYTEAAPATPTVAAPDNATAPQNTENQ